MDIFTPGFSAVRGIQKYLYWCKEKESIVCFSALLVQQVCSTVLNPPLLGWRAWKSPAWLFGRLIPVAVHPFVLLPTLGCPEQPLPPPLQHSLLLFHHAQQLLVGDGDVSGHPRSAQTPPAGKPGQRSHAPYACWLQVKK